jgi:hypothetical protein
VLKARTTWNQPEPKRRISQTERISRALRFQPSQPLRRNRLGARRSPEDGFTAANLTLLPLGRGETKRPIREASS